MHVRISEEKEIEFNKILQDLGLEHNHLIYEPSEKIRVQVPTEYDKILTVNVVYNIFKTKASFLYKDFEEHQDRERIKHIASKLNLNIPTRVSRPDWEIIHKQNPGSLTLDDNKKILFDFINGVGSVIRMGDGEHGPNPNDILIGFLWDGSLIVPISHPENARKRSVLNKKFGFGEMDQYNYQYAIYDENLNLKPI